MKTLERVRRAYSVSRNRLADRYRRSTTWIRRGPRLALPPATPIVVEHVRHGVLEIRLAGGQRRNVLGRSTIDQIEQIVESPPHGTKVIVFTGEDPDFCAGYDLVEASQGEPERLVAHGGNFHTLRSSYVPIVMALQGNVIGGGLELALLGDVRLASPETRFAIPASKLGLVYSENGARLVVEAFGQSVARSMFLGGRVIDADTALALGVVSEIVIREQLRGRALQLAEAMASWSVLATQGNRQVLDAVTGRTDADVEALHMTSFEPHGVLAETITDFVAKRAVTPVRPTPL